MKERFYYVKADLAINLSSHLDGEYEPTKKEAEQIEAFKTQTGKETNDNSGWVYFFCKEEQREVLHDAICAITGEETKCYHLYTLDWSMTTEEKAFFDSLVFKKTKVIEEMSDDSNCFFTEIWKDGRKLAIASDEGRGGEIDTEKLKAEDDEYKLLVQFDWWVSKRVVEIQTIKKFQSKNFVVKSFDDGEVYTFEFPKSHNSITKLKKAGNYHSYIETQRKNFKKEGYELLNLNL